MTPQMYENEIKRLKEEQFCLTFELNAMADLLLRKKGERWVCGFSDRAVQFEHAARYRWAAGLVAGKRVLDIACGSGAGSLLMAEEGGAKEVVACDLDAEALRYASIRNRHDAIRYQVADAENFGGTGKFDVIVSFETIEHLKRVDDFLRCVEACLADSGSFFVSTPISAKPLDEHPENPYHLQEWGFEAFQQLVSAHFRIKKVYVQLRHHGRGARFPRLDRLRSIVFGSRRLSLDESEEMTPIPYDPERMKGNVIGDGVVGYQILHVVKHGAPL